MKLFLLCLSTGLGGDRLGSSTDRQQMQSRLHLSSPYFNLNSLCVLRKGNGWDCGAWIAVEFSQRWQGLSCHCDVGPCKAVGSNIFSELKVVMQREEAWRFNLQVVFFSFEQNPRGVFINLCVFWGFFYLSIHCHVNAWGLWCWLVCEKLNQSGSHFPRGFDV